MNDISFTLQKTLKQLLNSITDTSTIHSNSPETFIKEIDGLFQITELTPNTIGIICSHIFHVEYGILAVLKKIKSSTEPKFNSLKCEALELLSKFIDGEIPNIFTYGVEIKEISFQLANHINASAKIKVCSYKLLIKTLTLYKDKSSEWSEKLDIKKLVLTTYSSLASKISPTVKEQVFNLLGTIVKYYPYVIHEYIDRIVNNFKQEINSQINSKYKKFENSIVCGCFAGLRKTLAAGYPSEPKQLTEVFDHMLSILNPREEKAQSQLYKEILQLLSEHGIFFSDNIFKYNETLYGYLLHWADHKNIEIKKCGLPALQTFLEVISIEIAKRRCKATFMTTMKNLKSIMDQNYTDMKKTSVIMKGFASLAKPCKEIFVEDVEKNLNLIFETIMKKIGFIYSNEKDLKDYECLELPMFLESLGKIVDHIEYIPEHHLKIIKKLAILQIQYYPKFSKKLQFLCPRAISILFLALKKKETVFKEFLADIIYASLVHICTQTIIPDIFIETESSFEDLVLDPNIVTYKNFLKLWGDLFDIPNISNILGFNREEKQTLSETIYNEMIIGLIEIFKKMDLGSINKDKTDFNHPEEDYDELAENFAQKTGIAVINLVHFSRDLLSHKKIAYFKKWIHKFGLETITLSTRYPKISGFYKLIAMCMQNSSKLNYFEEYLDSNQLDESSMDIDNSELNSEKAVSFKLFTKFALQLTLKLEHFKEELLISSLQVILSLPSEIISKKAIDLLPALEKTFNLGLNYLPLTAMGLTALERWNSSIDKSGWDKICSGILPLLNVYLVDKSSFKDDSIETITQTLSKSSTRKKSNLQPKLRHLKTHKADVYGNEKSQLEKIQIQILQFLGSLGGVSNTDLVQSDQIVKAALAWDRNVNTHLKFAIPFKDCKPEIYLDVFLPRVVELATSSSDKNIKNTARELLHSLVIYMLGVNSSLSSDMQNKYSQECLYRHIFPALLQIACDADEDLKMFKELVPSIIHWFTKRNAWKSPETHTILKTIWESLTQSENTTLREFSAQCLREFVVWTVKHTQSDKIEHVPTSMKNVLTTLCSYLSHSNSSKRLGAALAFNHIYLDIRQEESIINIFIFDILFYLIHSLSLVQEDDISFNTQEETKKAIDNVARLVDKNHLLLIDPFEKRRDPPGFTNVTLEQFVLWAIEQCGKPQQEYRRKCMQLVSGFAPLLPNIKTPKDLFDQLLAERGCDFFIKRFESRSSVSHSTPDLENNFDLQVIREWLNGLLSILDVYVWIFSTRLFSPHQIWNSDHPEGTETYIFRALAYFLDKVPKGEMRIEEFSLSYDLTPKEKFDYNRLCCQIIIRMFNLLGCLCANYHDDLNKCVPHAFWSTSLWNCLTLAILKPSTIGFDMSDPEISKRLPEEIEKFLQLFNKGPHPLAYKNYLVSYLSSSLDVNLDQLKTIDANQKNLDLLFHSQIFRGYCILISTQIWQPEDKDQLIKCLVSNIRKSSVIISSNNDFLLSNIDLIQSMIELTLALGIKTTKLLDLIINKNDADDSHPNVGGLIFSTFKNILGQHLLLNADIALPFLLENCTRNEVFLKFLFDLLTQLERDSGMIKKYGEKTVKIIYNHWSKLSAWQSPSANESDINNLLILLSNILIISNKTSQTSKKTKDIIAEEAQKEKEEQLLVQSFLCILNYKTKHLSFKINALELLPTFLTSYQNRQDDFHQCLNKLADHFPIRSTEFATGSAEHNQYKYALSNLLKALEISKNVKLLEFIAKRIFREKNHPILSNFHATIEDIFKTNTHQIALTSCLLEIFFDSNEEENFRLTLLEEGCIFMINHMTGANLVQLFTKHLQKLLNCSISYSYQHANFSPVLVSKIGGYKLSEAVYLNNLSETDLEQISNLFKESPKRCTLNKFLLVSCKTDLDVNKNSLNSTQSTEFDKNLVRLFYCAVYNCLITVIKKTNLQRKFVQSFVFSNTFNYDTFDNVLDLEKKMDFKVFAFPIKKIKTLSISTQNIQAADDHESTAQFNISQHLLQSSLSLDTAQFDFTSTHSAFSFTKKEWEDRNKAQSFMRGNQQTENTNFVEIEQDELNSHECMSNLVEMINSMQTKKVYGSETEAGTQASQLPEWLQFFRDKLVSSRSHLNVKIFIAKILLNCANNLVPYRSFLINPLLELVNERDFFITINYFVLDLLKEILAWDVKPNSELANSVLNKLMAKCFDIEMPVFKNNLKLVNYVLSNWKEVLKINYTIIFEQMKMRTKDKKDNLPGILLLSCVLSNEFPLCFDVTSRLKLLLENLENNKKDIYTEAAEAIGLLLRNKEKQNYDDDNIESAVHTAFMNLFMNNSDRGKFIICCHRTSIYFPTFADKHLSRLITLYANVHGIFLSSLMEIIQDRAHQLEGCYKELKNLKYFDFTNKNDETIGYRLRTLQTIFQKLNAKELYEVVSVICEDIGSFLPQDRLIIYNILKMIHSDKSKTGTWADHLQKLSKEGLIRALGDSSKDSRVFAHEYWSDKSVISHNTRERLLYLLPNLYSPNTEAHFLKYVTSLVMELTSKSTDYKRKMFENPLAECHFEECKVDFTNKRAFNLNTPFFASTLAPDGSFGGGSKTFDDSYTSQIRATQTYASMSKSLGIATDWLTGKSHELVYYTPSVNKNMSLISSVKAIQPSFDTLSMPGPSNRNSSSSNKVDIKTRFADRTNQEVKLSFMKKAEYTQNKLKADNKQKQVQKESQYSLLRNYRIGDFPDIEIEYKALIAPLQSLALLDQPTAQLLFQSLLKSICDTLKSDDDVRYNDYCTSINGHLAYIQKESKSYNPSIIGSSLNFMYHHVENTKIELDDVFSSAKESGQQNLGILFLEKKLLYLESDTLEPSFKRPRLDSKELKEDTSIWLKIADLYKSIEDYDSARGILSQNIGTKADSNKALELEAKGDFERANVLYRKLYENGTKGGAIPEEINSWEEASFKCMETLTNWSELNEVIDKRCSSPEELWRDSYLLDHYMKYYMKSSLKQIQYGHDNPSVSKFKEFINQANEDNFRKSFLVEKYSEHLALLEISKKNFESAYYYCNLSLEQFIAEWASLNPLTPNLHCNKLQGLQKLVEMKEFLNIFKSIEEEQVYPEITQLIARWSNRNPNVLDTANIWGDIIDNRIFYINILFDKFEEQYNSDIESTVQSHIFECRKKYLESMIHQDQKTLSNKILKLLKKLSDESDALKTEYSYSKLKSDCHFWKMGQDISIDDIWSTLKVLKELEANDSSALINKYYYTSQVSQVLYKHFGDVTQPQRQSMVSYFKQHSEKELPSYLLKDSYFNLKQATNILEDIESSARAENHLILAQFCNKILRKKETDNFQDNLFTNPNELAEDFIGSIFMAMTHGSTQAMQFFPRALQILEFYPDCKESFISKSKDLPCWMFLQWINQMVAILDSAEADALQNILSNIAKFYPMALVFSFKLSYENYKFGNDEVGNLNKSYVERLKKKLACFHDFEEFIEAIGDVGAPHLEFKELLENVIKKKQKKESLKEIMKYSEGVCSRLFYSHGRTSFSNSSRGTIRDQFSKKFGAEVEKLFGPKGSNLYHVDFECQGQEISCKMNTSSKLPRAGKLKDFSPWLASYHLRPKIQPLEIPGQYTGRFKPSPQYHTTISGFGEEVTVLPSLFQPRRITIRGNDEKEYKFLMKAGDDLRQDNRIQQVFRLANDIFRQDGACSKRNLTIYTYDIFPLTTRFGLIQWIDNQKVLESFIDPKPNIIVDVKGQYINWLASFGNTGRKQAATLSEPYKQAFALSTREQVEQNYNRLVKYFDPFLLRDSFMKLCSSPEAFFMLRSVFSSSHAVLSVTQWLLGIQDRHNGNSLIHLDSGMEIGIDFGYAFGIATQMLPIPELTPFRLTPQILNLLSPLKEYGAFQSAMVHTLRALRNNKDLLLNLMDVFIKEPTLNWTNYAERHAKMTNMEGSTASYANFVINQAKRKLDGDNPSHITMHDLKFQTSCKEHYQRVCKGVSGVNIRADTGPKGLTVEQQVACLIDQATDPYILGLTFVHWLPWL